MKAAKKKKRATTKSLEVETHGHAEPSLKLHPGAVPIFGHSDYRSYLREIVRCFGDQRGFRSRLAAAAGCTPSLLSQVLGEEASFSLDHLYKIAQFLGLSEAEWSYLRELALIEKCSTAGARKDGERRAEAMRLQYGGGVFISAPAIAYDGAQMLLATFSLVHWDIFHLLGIPDGTPERLAQRVGLTVDVVKRVLVDWQRAGLVDEQADGTWRCRAARFTGQKQMMGMVAAMYKIRALNRSFSGQGLSGRWAAVRLKDEDVEEIKERTDELMRFVWRRADEREKDGDRLVILSLDVETL